jgi:hypothetical protein
MGSELVVTASGTGLSSEKVWLSCPPFQGQPSMMAPSAVLPPYTSMYRSVVAFLIQLKDYR